MKQLYLNMVAGLLLLVAVLLSIFWVRSYRGVDAYGVFMLDAKSIQSDIQIGINSNWGRIDGGITKLDYPDAERIWKWTAVHYYNPIRPDQKVAHLGLDNFHLQKTLHHQDQFTINTLLYSVPHWVLVVLFGLWPSVRFARMYRGYKTRNRALIEGRCLSCGYDMRATPEKCPECGHLALARLPKKERFSTPQKVIMLGIAIVSVTWVVVLMSI